MRKILIPVLFWFLIPGSGFDLVSQDSIPDLPQGYKRNVVKWNLTPFILWDKSNVNFSYERVLSPYRTFSVNAGYFVLPSIGLYDSLKFKNDREKWGFSVSGDYRFYFGKRNTNTAPDGLYWGIYGSYHHYQVENKVEVINSETVQGGLILDANLNIISAGIELGYQFVIKERLSIDLIFIGPSLSAYNTKFLLDGELTVDENGEYLEAIFDLLSRRFPGFNELVTTGVRNDKGVKTSMGLGLRYMIQVGYRF